MELKNIRLANWQVFFYELFLNSPILMFFLACPRLERFSKEEICTKLGRVFRYKSSPSSAYASLACGLFTSPPHA
jgi:hypothetical protein